MPATISWKPKTPGPSTKPSMDIFMAKDHVTVSLTRPALTPASSSAASTPSKAESAALTRHQGPEGMHFGANSKKSGSFSKISMETAGCQLFSWRKPCSKPNKVAFFQVSKQSKPGHSVGSLAFSVWYPGMTFSPTSEARSKNAPWSPFASKPSEWYNLTALPPRAAIVAKSSRPSAPHCLA